MSSIEQRQWEINFRDLPAMPGRTLAGWFECITKPDLMAEQTVEFLAENYIIHLTNIELITGTVDANTKLGMMYSHDGLLCIKIYDTLNVDIPMENILQQIDRLLLAISICLDFNLACHEVRFVAHEYGLARVARRKNFGRGVGFEVGERGLARQKMSKDLAHIFSGGIEIYVAIKHYLTGLSLLGLEDQISGLIDAAFMQFYQGCEIMCGHETNIEAVKKNIAKHGSPDYRELQIIVQQVWRVRHTYFGHGNANNIHYLSKNYDNLFSVAKQVLVARWLCKRLIDLMSPSGVYLVREMMLYANESVGHGFCGTVHELESAFRVEYKNRQVNIYTSDGLAIEKYQIK